MTDGLSDAIAKVLNISIWQMFVMQREKASKKLKPFGGAKTRAHQQNEMLTEGTTPRGLADVIASLADLVSGSADAAPR